MTTIQWFPGHMHKAQKEIQEILPKIDLIIEILDARIPFSSNNPLISDFIKDKPLIKVLNKNDLADKKNIKQWCNYYNNENVQCIDMTTTDKIGIQALCPLAKKLVPRENYNIKPIKTMIMGIPNVGKSTIINFLAGRNVAVTGNQPAVTRQQQLINLGNGIHLLDTPGILWPKVENKNSGFRLAATGAIRDTAIDYQEVAFFLVDYLSANYQKLLLTRFELMPEDFSDPILTLEAIGRKRGCIQSKGRVNLHKASEILIHDFRNGKLGQISLETPEMIESELIETQKLIEKQKDEKIKKKEQRRKRYLKNKK
ncbi:ribosome biogenesis GTPase YlqF [Paraphotobacterium marinum]|uniref:Ribosome biogenesis GTPase A n=1 Tax=Paraphotobacterium marinum TaxID=1755811 RepID=A0A220VHG1_9GAMM|nr:ribosome biogenesis GTPase YlqF [Paraphotobacterium marinum]ASK79797.1 ribosome biogenesis GTPase YlqF [Paraphotobacterium marinum]